MPNVEKVSGTGQESVGIAGWLAPALAVLALVGLAGAFWAMNGASVFAQLISSAWALCF